MLEVRLNNTFFWYVLNFFGHYLFIFLVLILALFVWNEMWTGVHGINHKSSLLNFKIGVIFSSIWCLSKILIFNFQFFFLQQVSRSHGSFWLRSWLFGIYTRYPILIKWVYPFLAHLPTLMIWLVAMKLYL